LLADSLLSEPPGKPIRYLFLIILEITVVKKKSAFYVCHDFNEKQIKINGYHLIMVTNYHPHGGLKQQKMFSHSSGSQASQIRLGYAPSNVSKGELFLVSSSFLWLQSLPGL